jgi:hypothetical protein
VAEDFDSDGERVSCWIGLAVELIQRSVNFLKRVTPERWLALVVVNIDLARYRHL